MQRMKSESDWTDDILDIFYPDNATPREDARRIVAAIRAEALAAAVDAVRALGPQKTE